MIPSCCEFVEGEEEVALTTNEGDFGIGKLSDCSGVRGEEGFGVGERE